MPLFPVPFIHKLAADPPIAKHMSKSEYMCKYMMQRLSGTGPPLDPASLETQLLLLIYRQMVWDESRLHRCIEALSKDDQWQQLAKYINRPGFVISEDEDAAEDQQGAWQGPCPPEIYFSEYNPLRFFGTKPPDIADLDSYPEYVRWGLRIDTEGKKLSDNEYRGFLAAHAWNATGYVCGLTRPDRLVQKIDTSSPYGPASPSSSHSNEGHSKAHASATGALPASSSQSILPSNVFSPRLNRVSSDSEGHTNPRPPSSRRTISSRTPPSTPLLSSWNHHSALTLASTPKAQKSGAGSVLVDPSIRVTPGMRHQNVTFEPSPLSRTMVLPGDVVSDDPPHFLPANRPNKQVNATLLHPRLASSSQPSILPNSMVSLPRLDWGTPAFPRPNAPSSLHAALPHRPSPISISSQHNPPTSSGFTLDAAALPVDVGSERNPINIDRIWAASPPYSAASPESSTNNTPKSLIFELVGYPTADASPPASAAASPEPSTTFDVPSTKTKRPNLKRRNADEGELVSTKRKRTK
ncbi:hypothetical protein VKT23_010800 [Stygiomarasmius scandens]|uniref:Uncharacterized protein n=1 Tax=Marasmiellus scandens TaxID=2682957 RepID=A0ABR1JB65_9AGAR